MIFISKVKMHFTSGYIKPNILRNLSIYYVSPMSLGSLENFFYSKDPFPLNNRPSTEPCLALHLYCKSGRGTGISTLHGTLSVHYVPDSIASEWNRHLPAVCN